MSIDIDFLIILLYLIGITVWGIFSGGRQKSEINYFLGAENVPWFAVTLSIVAAETSTLTFISIPGLAYLTNLNFLQVTFGYLIGRIIIAKYFLPVYYAGSFQTPYGFIGEGFGKKVQKLASGTFIVTRLLADGVRLFATAIPLKFLLNISYEWSIIIIAAVAILYSIFGGIKGIIWTDVIQWLIYIAGAAITLGFISLNSGETLFNIFKSNIVSSKFEIIDIGFSDGLAGFFTNAYTLIGGLLGGAFLSMASHGTDHLIVQRLLALNNLQKSKKAIIASGLLVIIQFALFLIVGVFLFFHFGGETIADLNLTRADEIFPAFIISDLPLGLKGIIIAGIIAAALSSLAASISSITSSTVVDILSSFKFYDKVKNKLTFSRILTLGWAVALSSIAFLFKYTSALVVETALGIAAFTYGGLLGLFILGKIRTNTNAFNASISFIVAIAVMVIVVFNGLVAWTWYTMIGVSATILTSYIISIINKNKIDTGTSNSYF